MSTKIQIKRNDVAGETPGTSDIEYGELAVNVTDKKLYTRDNAGTIITLASGAQSYTHPSGDGNLHVPATVGVANSGKVLTAGATAGSLSWTTPEGTTYTSGTNITISGTNVISSTDTTYSNFAGTTAGLVPTSTTTDDTKFLRADGTWVVPTDTGDTTYTGTGLISIDGSNVISTTANNYSHPSGDGNLHVPATGGSNDGKVLTAGSTDGSLSWTTPSSTYTLPEASSSALGGIKIGYVSNAKNYPIQLSSGKAFVNVPWSGGNYVSSTTAPASPVNGDHWFDSAEGILYLRLDSNWVDVTTASASAGGGGVSSMGGTMTSHIIPDTDDTYDIGSATYKVRDLYLGENSLHIGDANISAINNGVILPFVQMAGHIIPDANDTYDIGSAEYKIRDLYVSDNSLWIGDDHKVSVEGGKQKNKKRKKGKTPKKVFDALIGDAPKPFPTEADLKAKFKIDIHDPAPDPTVDPEHVDFQPLTHQWLHFAIINGMVGAITPENIFDDTDDFADEAVGGLTDLSDVDLTTTAPEADQVLKYDGTKWIPGVGGGSGGGTNLTAGVIWDNHSTTAYDYTNDGSATLSSGTTATDITVVSDKTAVLTHTSDSEELRSVYIEKYVEEVEEVPNYGKTVVANGDVHHSTSFKKTGESSISFDGVSDYLTVANHSDFVLSSDFTIEMFFYPNAIALDTAQPNLIRVGNDQIYMLSGAQTLNMYSAASSTSLAGQNAIVIGQWNHMALVRSSGSVSLYLNGVLEASMSNSSTIFSGAVLIGSYTGSSGDFNGYMDEIRISNTSRYTAAFTPSTTAFSPDSNTVLLIQSDTTVNGSTTFADSVAATPAIPAYWQLESFDDWGVQFTSPTTTTLVNNTGDDAAIRARITKPTGVGGGSGGGATTLADLTDSTTATIDPLITSNQAVGHFWINSTSGEAFVCTDATTDENVWTNIGEGSGNLPLSTVATGGAVTVFGDYTLHIFTTGGVFDITSTANGVIDVMIVGGGGGGGDNYNQRAAGGGAGGLIFIQNLPVVQTSYAIDVGAGGAEGYSGSNSTFVGEGRTLTSFGGGHGGYDNNTDNAEDGGSGGGNWYPGYTGANALQLDDTSDGISTYSSTGFGSNGGLSGGTTPYGGGGGGAGGAGANYNSGSGGVGGVGKDMTSYFGSSVGEFGWFAGGGGSGGLPGGNERYDGGTGGGGRGWQDGTETEQNGLTNTGGGGGAGGAGGSGIVIVRYLT